MRELSHNRIIVKRYEVDNGWNLPHEVMEENEIKIKKSKRELYKRVLTEYQLHRGEWLTEEIAKKYEAMSWVYRVIEDYQYVGKVRELGQELQDIYGVTELEAFNILNGVHIKEYVNKYNRIKNRVPLKVNEDLIREEVIGKYCDIAM